MKVGRYESTTLKFSLSFDTTRLGGSRVRHELPQAFDVPNGDGDRLRNLL